MQPSLRALRSLPQVRTKLVTMALKSGQLDAELHAELGSAPHGPEALLASGSARDAGSGPRGGVSSV